MKNPLDDPSIRRLLEESERMRKNPAYQAWEQHQERLRNNPGLKAVLEETERRNSDPQYRALLESIDKDNRDPARRAILEEIERRNSDPQYRALLESIERDDRDPARRAIIEEITRRIQNPNYAAIRDFLSEFDRNVDEPPPAPAEVTDLVETVKELTPELIEHLRSSADDLIKLDPYVAEHLVGELLRANGFHEVRLVGRDAATSADIFAVTRIDPIGIEVRIFVEVKWWKDRVGIGVINQVLGAMLGEQPDFGWRAAMIVSAAGFTEFEKWTLDEISFKGVALKDRDDLTKWLTDYTRSPNGLWLPKPPQSNP